MTITLSAKEVTDAIAAWLLIKHRMRETDKGTVKLCCAADDSTFWAEVTIAPSPEGAQSLSRESR